MSQSQSRLLLLPGEYEVWLPGGEKSRVKVLIVDRRSHGYGGATCTIVLRERIPEGATWTGSREPGGIADVDADDLTVDLTAVEAGMLP